MRANFLVLPATTSSFFFNKWNLILFIIILILFYFILLFIFVVFFAIFATSFAAAFIKLGVC